MRILYLHPNAWTGEYAILRKLRELGHEVHVLEERRDMAQGKRLLVEHFREPDDGIRTLWYDPRRGWERLLTWPLDRVFRGAFDGRNLVHRMWVIREGLREFAPDVVICSDGFSYAIPAALLKRLRMLMPRLVVSYIGGDILDCPEADVGKRRTPMVSWLIRSSLKGIDVMRPLCKSLAAILRAEGADPMRIHVLPIHLVAPRDRLDDIYAHRAEIRAATRARLGLARDIPLVVTLSGNQKGKGLHLLAQDWGRITRAVPGIHWLLCGPDDPWVEKAVRPLLREQGLEKTVLFTGRIGNDDVFHHLACADLHVNPTLCEGLNMVTVEAAAVGTPTITSDGAGISDWVRRYDAGVVVPHGEAAPLADAIIVAFRSPEILSRWGSNGRPMAREFLIERIAPAMINLLAPQS